MCFLRCSIDSWNARFEDTNRQYLQIPRFSKEMKARKSDVRWLIKECNQLNPMGCDKVWIKVHRM